jgi:hypothetical protein
MTNEKAYTEYRVSVVNIKYGKELYNKVKNKPSMTVVAIPENILSHQDDVGKFNDMIESFIYAKLTKKYEAEVYNCQIWLPL